MVEHLGILHQGMGINLEFDKIVHIDYRVNNDAYDEYIKYVLK